MIFGAGIPTGGGGLDDMSAPLTLWLDGNDLSTMWADEAGTTPINGDDLDTIKRIDNKGSIGGYCSGPSDCYYNAAKTGMWTDNEFNFAGGSGYFFEAANGFTIVGVIWMQSGTIVNAREWLEFGRVSPSASKQLMFTNLTCNTKNDVSSIDWTVESASQDVSSTSGVEEDTYFDCWTESLTTPKLTIHDQDVQTASAKSDYDADKLILFGDSDDTYPPVLQTLLIYSGELSAGEITTIRGILSETWPNFD